MCSFTTCVKKEDPCGQEQERTASLMRSPSSSLPYHVQSCGRIRVPDFNRSNSAVNENTGVDNTRNSSQRWRVHREMTEKEKEIVEFEDEEKNVNDTPLFPSIKIGGEEELKEQTQNAIVAVETEAGDGVCLSTDAKEENEENKCSKKKNEDIEEHGRQQVSFEI